MTVIRVTGAPQNRPPTESRAKRAERAAAIKLKLDDADLAAVDRVGQRDTDAD